MKEIFKLPLIACLGSYRMRGTRELLLMCTRDSTIQKLLSEDT